MFIDQLTVDYQDKMLSIIVVDADDVACEIIVVVERNVYIYVGLLTTDKCLYIPSPPYKASQSISSKTRT